MVIDFKQLNIADCALLATLFARLSSGKDTGHRMALRVIHAYWLLGSLFYRYFEILFI